MSKCIQRYEQKMRYLSRNNNAGATFS